MFAVVWVYVSAMFAREGISPGLLLLLVLSLFERFAQYMNNAKNNKEL